MVIGDPTNSALSDGFISGWQIYAKIVSIEHRVFLQVWRPSPASTSYSLFDGVQSVYTLVGQTHVEPTELRFHEIVLQASEFIGVRAGDVLGLYFPSFNPIGWSAVPCGSAKQRYAFFRNPVNVTVGSRFRFQSTAPGRNVCRYYSFAAIFGRCTFHRRD